MSGKNELSVQSLRADVGGARLAVMKSSVEVFWRMIVLLVAVAVLEDLIEEWLGIREDRVWDRLDAFIMPLLVSPVLFKLVLPPLQELARKQAELVSEAKFQAIANAASEGLILLTKNLTVRFANRAAESILGYQPGTLAGMNIMALVPEETARMIAEQHEQFLRTGSATILQQSFFEAVAKRRDGAEIPVDVSVSVAPEDDEPNFVVFFRDITGRKRMETILRESERTFRGLLEDLPVGVRILRDFKVLYVNPADVEMHGYRTAEEVLATDGLEMVAPEDRERIREYHRRRQAGEPVPDNYRVRRLRRDGRTFLADLSVRRILYQGEWASLVVLQDLSDRERLQLYERLLPVCCVCGKIRDDSGTEKGQGTWERLDHYVAQHSDAQISHTFCPDCLAEYKRREGLK
jgi:PAS domain S-box-containing protein